MPWTVSLVVCAFFHISSGNHAAAQATTPSFPEEWAEAPGLGMMSPLRRRGRRRKSLWFCKDPA
jgi:hypothetical protein